MEQLPWKTEEFANSKCQDITPCEATMKIDFASGMYDCKTCSIFSTLDLWGGWTPQNTIIARLQSCGLYSSQRYKDTIWPCSSKQLQLKYDSWKAVAMLEEICSMCCAPWICGLPPLNLLSFLGPCAYCAGSILASIFARLCTNAKVETLRWLRWSNYRVLGFSRTPGYLLESAYQSHWCFCKLNNSLPFSHMFFAIS